MSPAVLEPALLNHPFHAFWLNASRSDLRCVRQLAAGYFYELAGHWRLSADARKRELAEAWLVEFAPERYG